MTAADTPDAQADDWRAVDAVGPYAIIPHGSCGVGPVIKSQWRNTWHWHVVWPDGDHWCYETLLAADDRRQELEDLATEDDRS